MPEQWRSKFKEIMKRVCKESINDLANYFDLLYQSDTSSIRDKLNWTQEDWCQEAFDIIKSSLVAQDAMLAFPNTNYTFVIEPDASDYQQG